MSNVEILIKLVSCLGLDINFLSKNDGNTIRNKGGVL
ncbi:MAG: hypothetical protein TIS_02619 [Tissierella sp.]|jgi:hypothetical protein